MPSGQPGACSRKKYKTSPGEQLVGMLLAADRRQARMLKKYISGLLHADKALESLIVKELQESVELLVNGVSITIEIHTSSFRSTLGYTSIFVICDEVAFWPSDGPDSDAEILSALGPTLQQRRSPHLLEHAARARRGSLRCAPEIFRA